MFRILFGFWFSIIKYSLCVKIAVILLKLQLFPRRHTRGLVGEGAGCVWKRRILVVNRWRHSAWEFWEALPCVLGGRGCVSERDVYSVTANYLTRLPESRAQFGSVLHFLGTFDLSSLILMSAKIFEHKVFFFFLIFEFNYVKNL